MQFGFVKPSIPHCRPKNTYYAKSPMPYTIAVQAWGFTFLFGGDFYHRA